ncbi:unnamed protein product, partial [Rhizoctonia solani]
AAHGLSVISAYRFHSHGDTRCIYKISTDVKKMQQVLEIDLIPTVRPPDPLRLATSPHYAAHPQDPNSQSREQPEHRCYS